MGATLTGPRSVAPMTAVADIPGIVDDARRAQQSGALHAIDDRKCQLRQLRRFLVEEEEAIVDALHSDLGKSAIEAYVTEIGFTIGEIDHTLDNLEKWTKTDRVWIPLHFRPGKARIVQQPLGTVLIIAPWNYPLQLVLAPLIPAIAAGNTAVLKPSEVAPATASLIEDMLPRYVDPAIVKVVTGGVPETTALLEQRFDHVFYTGNGTVGRVVMKAAAEHLTPVTLELGGKSPAIVTSSADVEVSARRIAWGKFVNAGQTCVAPDYVLADTRVVDELVNGLRAAVSGFFGDDPATSDDYGRIVDERHHGRLTELLDAGGFDEIAVGGDSDRANRYLAPTVLTGVKPDAKVMEDEIFGPILPVLTYDSLDDAIDYVNDHPTPLAMYVFSGRSSTVDGIVDRTSAGGVTVNHTLLHLAVNDLPFGGVGASGMGAYHGEAGFRIFSHAKPVLHRGTTPDPSLAYPPYTGLKQKIMRKLF